jgi:hypothetical protein
MVRVGFSHDSTLGGVLRIAEKLGPRKPNRSTVRATRADLSATNGFEMRTTIIGKKRFRVVVHVAEQVLAEAVIPRACARA